MLIPSADARWRQLLRLRVAIYGMHSMFCDDIAILIQLVRKLESTSFVENCEIGGRCYICLFVLGDDLYRCVLTDHGLDSWDGDAIDYI